MKPVYLINLIFCVYSAKGQNIPAFDYSFTTKNGVSVYSVSNKKAVVVNKQTDPYISPDGTKLAYTANAGNGDRHVEVTDLVTKQKTLLATKNNNCYGPVWSPDGQWIAYNAFINSTWFICIIDKDNHSHVDPELWDR
jgi:TolB protein